MISPAAKDRAIGLIDSGVAEGAELLLDGRACVVEGVCVCACARACVCVSLHGVGCGK